MLQGCAGVPFSVEGGRVFSNSNHASETQPFSNHTGVNHRQDQVMAQAKRDKLDGTSQ